MSALIGLLALAAIVGMFKPYVPGSRRWQFVVAFFVLAVVSSRVRDDAKPSQLAGADITPKSKGSAAVDEVGEQPSPPISVPATEENWTYSTDKDEMRGTTTRFASVESNNEVDLKFPYGSVHGRITVRKRPEDGLNILFSVEKGQILCSSFSENYISIKFDNGPIHHYRCSQSTDGKSETAFLAQ